MPASIPTEYQEFRPTVSLDIALQEIERPIVPRAAVSPHERTTAAPLQHVFEKQQRVEARSAGRDLNSQYFERLTIDCRPDVVLLADDLEFRFADGNLLAIPAVWLEQMPQPMEPLPNRPMGVINERFDFAV
jgi:hypothetical protein